MSHIIFSLSGGILIMTRLSTTRAPIPTPPAVDSSAFYVKRTQLKLAMQILVPFYTILKLNPSP